MSIYGPCVVCGATNYSLSMGGPTICPACDCGIPPETTKARREAEFYRAKADALAEALRDVLNWGHAPSVHDLIDDLERRMDRAAAVLTAYDGETGG